MTLNTKARCLILACGNTLRGDDGLGPWLAHWAENRFLPEAAVRVVLRQQWTPELAEEIAHAEIVLFVDCAVDAVPGSVRLVPVEPARTAQAFATHHVGAAELLALCNMFYHSLPREALQLTIGAGSTQLGEEFSETVKAALPGACRLLDETVRRFLIDPA